MNNTATQYDNGTTAAMLWRIQLRICDKCMADRQPVTHSRELALIETLLPPFNRSAEYAAGMRDGMRVCH